MKLIYTTLAILIFSTGYSQNWIYSSFPEMNFKVKFYESPEHSVDTINLANNLKAQRHLWYVNVKDEDHPNTYYAAGVIILPKNQNYSDSSMVSIENLINMIEKSFVTPSEYNPIASNNDMKTGYPGKVLTLVKKNDGTLLKQRIYLVKNTVYHLYCVSKKNSYNNNYDADFFNSLSLSSEAENTFTLPLGNNYNPTYTIKFPENPIEENKIIDTDHGKTTSYIKRLTSDLNNDDNVLYLASETYYTGEPVDESDSYTLNKIYEKYIKDWSRQQEADLLGVKSFNYKNYQGKEFRAYTKSGTTLVVNRVILINQIIYTLTVYTAIDMDGNRSMKKFMNSFKLL